ncbi:MAG: porin family protein [Flavobacteriales bacterium]
MKNSRTILTAAFVSCIALSASQAQEFRLGGGYNGSNVQEAGPDQWVGRAGYQFGADLLLGGHWFVKPGLHFEVRNLNYSVAGVNEDGTPTGTDVEFRYTERALRVPLLGGLRLMDPADDPAFNIYLFGGPTALFNLSADLDNDALDVATKPAQWFLGFGAGLEISFIFLEAGYDVAMSNVFEGDDFDTNPKVNNLYISGGVRLQLAK